MLIMMLGFGCGCRLLQLGEQEAYADRQLIGIAELVAVCAEDLRPAGRCPQLALGNRGERVTVPYGDRPLAFVQAVMIEIRNRESPTDLQLVGAAREDRGIRGRDPAPLAPIAVVPLSQAPEIITGPYDVVMPGLVAMLRMRRCGSWQCG